MHVRDVRLVCFGNVFLTCIVVVKFVAPREAKQNPFQENVLKSGNYLSQKVIVDLSSLPSESVHICNMKRKVWL